LTRKKAKIQMPGQMNHPKRRTIKLMKKPIKRRKQLRKSKNKLKSLKWRLT